MARANVADVGTLGAEFFGREEALLKEHQRRVTGLGNIFQKLPWLAAASPLGGFEVDFVLLHAAMRPPDASASSLLRRGPRGVLDGGGGGGGSGVGTGAAAATGDEHVELGEQGEQTNSIGKPGSVTVVARHALEAKRRLLLRQRRRRQRLQRPPSSRRLSTASWAIDVEPPRGSPGDADQFDDPALVNDIHFAVSPPATPCAPDDVVVGTADAVQADSEALARYRQACERWACDEESLVLNRLADLAAEPMSDDGSQRSPQEIVRNLSDEFGSVRPKRSLGQANLPACLPSSASRIPAHPCTMI